jgi:hypothetical protein
MSLLFHGLNNSDLRSLDLKNVGDRQCVTVHYYKLCSDKGYGIKTPFLIVLCV